MTHTQVFLSSTTKDLQTHRESVAAAIRRLNTFKCTQMEDWGALHARPVDACRTKISECDVVVMIVGHYYGSCPQNSRHSFTRCEYEAALDEGKDVLVFLATDDSPIRIALIESDDVRVLQHEFRRGLAADHTCAYFKDEGELAQSVIATLANWKDEKYDVTIRQTERSRQVHVGASGLSTATDEVLRKMAASLEAMNERLLAMESDRVRAPDSVEVVTDPVQAWPRRLNLDLQADDQLSSARLRGADRGVPTLAELFGAHDYARKFLRPSRDRDKEFAAISEWVDERIEQLLDVDIAEILLRAWSAAPEVQQIAGRTATVNERTFVSLAEHSVTVTYKPVVDITHHRLTVGRLNFGLQAVLRVSGVGLTIGHGRIIQAHGCSVSAHGSMTLNGLTIAEISERPISGPLTTLVHFEMQASSAE